MPCIATCMLELPLLAQAAQDFVAAVQRVKHRSPAADAWLTHFVRSKRVGETLLHDEAWVGFPACAILMYMPQLSLTSFLRSLYDSP